MATKKKTAKKSSKSPATKNGNRAAEHVVAAVNTAIDYSGVTTMRNVQRPAPSVVQGPVSSKKLAALRALRQHINTNAKTTVIGFAEETAASFLLRRPCGIVELDEATGGGAPAGCLVEISGPEGAGKTYLAMQYMLMHQLLYGSESCMFYACTEPTKGFDFQRAAKMGLKLGLPPTYIAELEQSREVNGLPPFTKEELTNLSEKVGELLIIQAATGEQVFTAVLQCVASNEFGIGVIDSITSVLPEANAEKELDENNRLGARASLVTDFVSHYTPLANRFGTPHRTTVFGIGQARAKQNKQAYEKEWNTPAAWAWKHAVQLRIQVENGQKISKEVSKVKYVLGKEVKWTLTKGKAGAHEHMQGNFNFYFDDVLPSLCLPYGADRWESLITSCMSKGLLREQGGKISITNTVHELIASDIPGLIALKAMLQVDFEFELEVRQAMIKAHGVDCLYRE